MRPLLMTKVKNAFKGKEYSFFLKNININGSKRGCCGFIKSGEKCVYINTEPSCAEWIPPIMFRYAKNEKDSHGGTNQFCKTLEELVENVNRMLKED